MKDEQAKPERTTEPTPRARLHADTSAAGQASPSSVKLAENVEFRADAFDALMTRLEAFGDEFARLARTKEQAALAKEFGDFVGNEAHTAIAWLAEVRGRAPDPFDRIVADLPRQWHYDGHADSGETWEEWDAVEKIGYLAEHAARHNVSFERFVDAASRTLGLASLDQFTADDVGHLLGQYRDTVERQARSRAEPQRQPEEQRVAFSGAPADDRDDMPTPEEWPKLKAEWTHDYGLRRLEDRGVKYEDTAERPLDHAAEGGKGQGPTGEQDGPLARGIAPEQATVTPPGRAAKPAALPPHPWPSEVAKANRRQPEQDHDKSNSHEAGHSL